jgi:hypothetical protein
MPARPAEQTQARPGRLEASAEYLHRFRRPGLLTSANPPLLAYEMRDLGRVAAETHPIEPGLQVRHSPRSLTGRRSMLQGAKSFGLASY